MKKVRIFNEKLTAFFHAPEKVFLLLGLIFGLCYVFLTPPFQSPDEDIHFMSSWQYSTFDRLGGFPRNLVECLYEHLDAAIDKTGTVYSREIRDNFFHAECPAEEALQREYDTTLVPGLYSQYLVQMGAFKLAQIFTARYIFWLWAGRLANLALYLLVGYFAVKLAKFYRWGMVLLALMPMPLSLAGSLSYDVSINALSLLFFSLTQRLVTDEKPYGWKELKYFYLLGLAMMFLKFPYVLMYGVLLFVPAARFSRKYWKYVTIAFCLLLFAGAVGVNMRRAEDTGKKQRSDARPFYDRDARMRISRANPAEKLTELKHSPAEFIRAAGKTAVSIRIPFYAGSFVGILGWLTVWPPLWLLAIYGLLLLAAAGLEEENSPAVRFKWPLRSIFLLGGFGLVLLIHLIFYLAVALENGEIAGVQGKYFFPIALLFLLPLCGSWLYSRLKMEYRRILPYLFAGVICFTHIAVLLVLCRHFAL